MSAPGETTGRGEARRARRRAIRLRPTLDDLYRGDRARRLRRWARRARPQVEPRPAGRGGARVVRDRRL